MVNFFYDSYAIIEFINKNEKFKSYFLENEGVTTLYNLMEVYYSILKNEGSEKANRMLIDMKGIIIEINIEVIKEAMNFRLKNKNKKFSYTDCLGYTLAKKLSIKFLTGDEGFKNLPNVEFIKA